MSGKPNHHFAMVVSLDGPAHLLTFPRRARCRYGRRRAFLPKVMLVMLYSIGSTTRTLEPFGTIAQVCGDAVGFFGF
jgi:hypothetical protein